MSVGVESLRKVLHSFRHLFDDRAREANLGEELHDALTGHAGGGVGRDYGAGFSVKRLAEGMARVEFPGCPGVTPPFGPEELPAIDRTPRCDDGRPQAASRTRPHKDIPRKTAGGAAARPRPRA